MLELSRTTRGRAGIALVSSVAISALWIMLGLSIAILPGLVVIQWIAVFTAREPVSPDARLITIVLVLGIAVLMGVGGPVIVLGER